MTAPLSGYTATLPADVVLDSGQLYVGAAVFGAFNGGLKFDPGVEYRNIEFDGKRSPITALDRKTAFMPSVSGTVIQLSTTNVGQIEPGATVVATPSMLNPLSKGLHRFPGPQGLPPCIRWPASVSRRPRRSCQCRGPVPSG